MYQAYLHFALVSARSSVTLRILPSKQALLLVVTYYGIRMQHYCLEKGVPIEKIQYLLGHRSVNITRHYTQSAFLNVNDLEPTIL